MDTASIINDAVTGFWRASGYKITIWDKFYSDLSDELYKFKKENYKTLFIKGLIKELQNDLEKHKQGCIDPDCHNEKKMNQGLFFLNQELDEYAESSSDLEEIDFVKRSDADSKIDKILNELEALKGETETIKNNQVIIVEGLMEDFEELKRLYHLGKKNYRQIVIGKFGEMLASGVVSETVAKSTVELIKDFGKDISKLLLPPN